MPGKPLIELAGKSMIQRVYERASASDAVSVIVATDDQRIASAVDAFGGRVVMTSKSHPTGTDRIYEAVAKAGLQDNETVVNVQGDEPMLPAAVINQVAAAVGDGVEMATLCERITGIADVLDPNIVKVVIDQFDRAIYFSRAPVPWDRTHFGADSRALPDDFPWYRHLGIYAYTVSMLKRYVGWPETALEQVERLEQLRVLVHGESIRVLESVASIPPGIDVEADIERTLQALAEESDP